MLTHEKAAILRELATGRDALLEAVRGLPEDLAGISPAPGRWSVVECVEHLAVSEDFLLTQITQAKHSGTPVVNAKREAVILARGANRTTPLISPEEGRPLGRAATLAKAVESFLAARERTVRLVETCGDDLRSMAMKHPLLGTINCYEALLLIAVHPLRHAGQIREIRGAGL
ncbi:MAG: DinB family protein [Bryobacteraceae bacterium]